MFMCQKVGSILWFDFSTFHSQHFSIMTDLLEKKDRNRPSHVCECIRVCAVRTEDDPLSPTDIHNKSKLYCLEV